MSPQPARLAGDTFIIPLTFGNQSDWSRNVRAAGGCEIRLNGTGYRAVRPDLADGEQARDVIRAAFSPVERAMFRDARHQAVLSHLRLIIRVAGTVISCAESARICNRGSGVTLIRHNVPSPVV
jgi:hypothetical protein